MFLVFVFQDLNDVSLEGDITVPGLKTDDEDELSTLDEPVKDTIVIIVLLSYNIENLSIRLL